MDITIIGLWVLWTFLYGYLILGSIDFGSGFYWAYAAYRPLGKGLRALIARFLNPVWEVTNVFLVFFFVGIVGFFPEVAYYYGSGLLVPLSISIILLAIRGAFYAFFAYSGEEKRYLLGLHGLAGLFVPASLTTVLIASEGGILLVEDDHVLFSGWTLFTSPFAWSVVALALVSVLLIAAVFLSAYAHVADNAEAEAVFRRYSLTLYPPAVIIALWVIWMMRREHRWHYEQLLGVGWLLLISLIMAVVAYALIYRRSYTASFVMLAIQYGLAFYAYGYAHLPYVLYPYLTIQKAFVNEAMAQALVIGFMLGLVILVPSFMVLMKLFVFNRRYVQGVVSKMKGGES